MQEFWASLRINPKISRRIVLLYVQDVMLQGVF